MKNLIARLRLLPKRTSALMAIAVMAVAVPAALYAWGPSDRPTFTMAKPADHVTFNSITDNPKHGDERNFVQIRNYTDKGAFSEQVDLQPGKEYEVYVYYHNNASTTLNDAAHNYKGIATGSFMRVEIPGTIPAGNNGRLNGYVGASNAQPQQVWDEAYARNSTNGDMALRYVPNSAVIHSNGAVNGQQLDLNKLAGASGHPLGFNALDGKLPGCAEFAGYVTYRFTAVQPNFEVTKQVSISGKNDFKKEVKVDPGTEVQYKIQYNNTGTVQQDNVTIRDVLPKGATYVAGSTYISNSKTNSTWSAVAENTITQEGLNIGSYAPKGNAFLVFKAKIAAKDQLECGINKLVNTVHADTENGRKSDTATVIVEKDCPQPKDIIVCRLSDKKYPVTIKENEFDPKKYSKNPEDCKEKPAPKPGVSIDKKVDSVEHKQVGVNVEFTYQIRVTNKGEVDLKKVVVTDKAPEGVTFLKASHGTLTASNWTYAIPELKVGGSMDFTITAKVPEYLGGIIKNTVCVDAPEVPGNPDDCDDATVEVPPKPEDMVVCRLEDKKYPVTIKKNEFDETKHSTNPKDCEEVPVVPPTPVTPETPGELPRTGATDVLLSALGLGSLVTATAAYIASRRVN